MDLAPYLPLRWGFVFLHCPLKLSEEQRLGLVALAIRAYMDDLPRIDFDWEYCQGWVEVASEAVGIGNFYGQRFTAEVNLPEGSGSLEFLVTEAQMEAVRKQVAQA